jgi:hypothetical protein
MSAFHHFRDSNSFFKGFKHETGASQSSERLEYFTPYQPGATPSLLCNEYENPIRLIAIILQHHIL